MYLVWLKLLRAELYDLGWTSLGSIALMSLILRIGGNCLCLLLKDCVGPHFTVPTGGWGGNLGGACRLSQLNTSLWEKSLASLSNLDLSLLTRSASNSITLLFIFLSHSENEGTSLYTSRSLLRVFLRREN